MSMIDQQAKALQVQQLQQVQTGPQIQEINKRPNATGLIFQDDIDIHDKLHGILPGGCLTHVSIAEGPHLVNVALESSRYKMTNAQAGAITDFAIGLQKLNTRDLKEAKDHIVSLIAKKDCSDCDREFLYKLYKIVDAELDSQTPKKPQWQFPQPCPITPKPWQPHFPGDSWDWEQRSIQPSNPQGPPQYFEYMTIPLNKID